MILRTRIGDVSLRSAESLGQLIESRSAHAAGVSVSPRSVGGLPAAARAVTLAAEAVANLRFCVWRGDGAERKRVRTTWQSRFFEGVPNERESWNSVWEQTERSLTARNNAYWHKVRDAGRIVSVYVLAPDMVDIKWDRKRSRKLFRFRLSPGGDWSQWEDASSVLHFTAHVEPGCLVAPSPIDLHREALGSAIAKMRYESNFYDHGLQQALALTFPANVNADQAQAWKELYEANHAGIEKANGVSVFGGGVTIETIGLSLRDAQYIESAQFSVEEIARIFNVDVSLLGGGTMGASQLTGPRSPEHEQDRWLRYGLGPRLSRLEATVFADPDFFGIGARDYPQFDTSGVLRGDLKTEAEISKEKVQSGQWLVDEARARDGLPPLPNGMGQIPQVVPVGGQENPVPTPPLSGEELPAGYTFVFPSSRNGDGHGGSEELASALRDGVEALATLATRELPAPVVHNHHQAGDVHVEPTQVDVHVPEQPAPVVEVDVHVPEQPAPVVQNDVRVVSPPRKVTLKKDGQGKVVGAEVEDA